MSREILMDIACCSMIGLSPITPAKGQDFDAFEPDGGTYVDPLIQAVADSENFSISEAMELMDNQNDSIEIFKKAETIAGEDFAGSWLDKRGNGTVALSDGDLISTIEEEVGKESINFKLVEYSLSDLDSALDSVTKAVENSNLFSKVEASVNVEENRVDVLLPKEPSAQRSGVSLRSALVYEDSVIRKEVEQIEDVINEINTSVSSEEGKNELSLMSNL